MTYIFFGALQVSSDLEVVLQPPEKRTGVTRCATLVGEFVTWQAAAGTGYRSFRVRGSQSRLDW